MAVMRRAPFLRALEEEALKLLAFGSTPVALKPRQTLFEAGETADGAAMVLGGQLRLIATTEGVPARVAGVGTLVDELALIVPIERATTAIAQTSCEVLVIPRRQMQRILNEYPQSAQRLRTVVAERTAAFVGELEALASERFRPET